MGNTKLVAVAYSPTGTTLKVLEGIRSGWGEPSEILNVTAPCDRTNGPIAGDIVVVGVPVYSGRIPKEVRSFLETLRGDGRPAVAVVVYGNRHYDDALLELGNTLLGSGFKVVAGGAFIGEHSFATEEYPTAMGRPDQDDMAQAQSFGRAVREICLGGLDDIAEVELPGKEPYKEPSVMPEGSPDTIVEKCILCGKCASLCPVGAIDVIDPSVTDGVACTFCCACVKGCPTGARVLTLEPVASVGKRLWDNFSARREPEVFTPV
ncbi:4Fe-4S binding protein [Dethiosulfovibrio salsuginis]|uniref:4Fe-4S binding domain-containing protein n=1 Tax=Dethiosulfovibrio salsuginis TaxID=561720 RepID=A0A1X7KPZ8_9BACT|nr:4Fe-4S binding protein [Dethiosulfovibrio salsuginis]SMG43190.1 4Fe-4S binding domain-containing protein [Dethiosulfovibrio salsuginis]